jgi:hypothetical protein
MGSTAVRAAAAAAAPAALPLPSRGPRRMTRAAELCATRSPNAALHVHPHDTYSRTYGPSLVRLWQHAARPATLRAPVAIAISVAAYPQEAAWRLA